ncbi:MAG: hypothetical protein IKS27_03250 [Oscillospiraceae bacterium]|nr:hypothetical protein [Oscillospiraceae bacterium]
MAKVTPKENFLMLVDGGTPAYIPYYTMMGEPYLGEAATKMMMPRLFENTMHLHGGYDMWGVRHVAAEGTNGATMPDTSIVMIEDIEDWESILKFPKRPEHYDLEKMYREDLKLGGIDRTQSAVLVGPGLMPFQQLVALCGFVGGLIALTENPEAVKDMLNAMVDFLEPYYTAYIDVYKPDIWSIADDTCAKTAPFFSVEVYRDVFKPIYKRLCKPAVERGIPVIFHNCGFCEPFIADMVDVGVKILEPMQDSNDLIKVKNQFKGKLSLIGGCDWATLMPPHYPEYDEQELRAHVRRIIDKNAPGGAYGFYAWPISYVGDPVIGEVNRIIRDEAHWYGRKYTGYTES